MNNFYTEIERHWQWFAFLSFGWPQLAKEINGIKLDTIYNRYLGFTFLWNICTQNTGFFQTVLIPEHFILLGWYFEKKAEKSIKKAVKIQQENLLNGSYMGHTFLDLVDL